MKKFFVLVVAMFLCVMGVSAQECDVFVNGRKVHNDKMKISFDARFNENFTLSVESCDSKDKFEYTWTNKLNEKVIGTQSSISFPTAKLMNETVVIVMISKLDAYFVKRIEITVVKKNAGKEGQDYL